MSRMILIAILAAAAWATPALAQYRFDWRIDPQVCDWRWTCDYGGRAYLPRWTHRRRWVHRVGLHHVCGAERVQHICRPASHPDW
jgi:hypothetical protein